MSGLRHGGSAARPHQAAGTTDNARHWWATLLGAWMEHGVDWPNGAQQDAHSNAASFPKVCLWATSPGRSGLGDHTPVLPWQLRMPHAQRRISGVGGYHVCHLMQQGCASAAGRCRGGAVGVALFSSGSAPCGLLTLAPRKTAGVVGLPVPV